MEKLIQSAVTLLQSKYNLPSEGFLAGGALANTIFNIVTGKMAPINDIDIYRIIDIKDNGQLTFLLGDTARLYDFLLAKSVNQDVHVMNKRNILANLDRLLELA